NLVLSRSARRSAELFLGKNSARLRALRLLHRHLSDLCAAWRRTRFAARAHLSDQGDARKRSAGHTRGGQTYRPLSFLLGLHDHLSVRRELHAPRRSCPRAYRENLQTAVARSRAARPAGPCAARSRLVPYGGGGRTGCAAVRGRVSGAWV